MSRLKRKSGVENDKKSISEQNISEIPQVELNKNDITYLLKLINKSKFEIEGKDLQSLFTLIQKLQLLHSQMDD